MKATCFMRFVFESENSDSYEYTMNLIIAVAKSSGIDISGYDMGQIIKGMKHELEHGSKMGEDTNVTGDDPVQTLRITIAHLKEDERYYDKLESFIDKN